MKVQCKRCQHVWDYQGQKRPNRMFPVYICCPSCRIQVRLPVDDSKGRPDALAGEAHLTHRWIPRMGKGAEVVPEGSRKS